MKDKMFNDGIPGDILVIVGLADSLLVCNFSQRIRDGWINNHVVNNLELVKSAYDDGYDHYNIPISWFTSIPLKSETEIEV